MQLDLFTPQAEPETVERWQFPMCILYEHGGSNIFWVTARSRTEAEKMTESYWRSKGLVFRRAWSDISTYGRKTLGGYSCNPVKQSDRWL